MNSHKNIWHTIVSLLRSRIALFVLVFALFSLWSSITLDPDFGWHLRSGQYFIEHGIPKYDVFTYTATDFHWVNHEWLSDIVVALVFGVGSYWLLMFMYGAMWTIAVAIMSRGVHWALVISATVAILPFAGIRALTWSALGLALLSLLLRQKNKRWRLIIPLLFLIWANVHGSFLVGIVYGGWRVLQERSWKLAIIGVTSLAVTFINPYGVGIYTEVFRTMLDSELHANIVEWARFALPLSAIPYVLTWLGLTVYRNRRIWKRYVRFENLLFIMSVTSMRMTPLFVLVSLQGLQQTIEEIDSSLPKKYQKERWRVAKIAAVVLVVATMLVPVAEALLTRSSGTRYPADAVHYLEKNPCNGNLFNSYNFGGYLIWKLPSHKVYIDGRMPSWEHKDGTYMKDLKQVFKDKEFRNQQFKKYTVRCVLVENTQELVQQLTDEGWIVKVDDGYSSLLVSP